MTQLKLTLTSRRKHQSLDRVVVAFGRGIRDHLDLCPKLVVLANQSQSLPSRRNGNSDHAMSKSWGMADKHPFIASQKCVMGLINPQLDKLSWPNRDDPAFQTSSFLYCIV